MEKKNLLAVAIAGFLLLGFTGIVSAGVEPSPFISEINKLHSIELQVAAINKRVAKLNDFETLPEGATDYLNAMANKMQDLKTRLEGVLDILPTPINIPGGAYIGQDEVVFALDSIRSDSKGAFIIVEDIVSRMGVGPSPFLPLFRDVSIRIIERINIHILPILDPIDPPSLPPQLP